MEQETEGRRHSRRQSDLRSINRHLLRTGANVRLKLKPNQGCQVGTSPVTDHQQLMRAAKGLKARFETVERSPIGAFSQCLPSHRLNNAEHVLDAMGQLTKE